MASNSFCSIVISVVFVILLPLIKPRPNGANTYYIAPLELMRKWKIEFICSFLLKGRAALDMAKEISY